MKKIVCLIVSAVLILSASGCATSSCGKGLFGGLFQGGLLSNQPIRSFFRGAPCSTCNPPAGQPANCNSNVAPLCEGGSCGLQGNLGGPAVQMNGQGVPYYDNGSNLGPQTAIPTNAPVYGNQGSSNRVPYDMPTIEAFGSDVLDADAFPPSL